MDFRLYLQLESDLQNKLLKAWRPTSTELFHTINDLIAEGKFDAASHAVKGIDFSDVGEECRNYIKYLLQSCIYFGGSMVHGNAPGNTFVSVANHDALLDRVTDNFIQTLTYNVTNVTQRSALQSIAQAQAQPATKKEKVRYVKDFVSFQQTGNNMMKLVSSLHSSRLSTWGFMAEASVMGYDEYQLTAVLDGRTSDFCRAIDGKRFKVSDGTEFVNKVLRVDNPDDVKSIQPWPDQDKKSIARYSDASSEQLTEWGLHIPPFHPHCRTLCTKVGSAPKIQVPDIPEANRIIPQTRSTAQDFSDMGIQVTPKQLDHWNGYMQVPPVEVASRMSGRTGMETMEQNTANAIQFAEDGNIDFQVSHKLPEGGDIALYSTYDPFASVLYSLQADVKNAKPADVIPYLSSVLNGMVDVGLSVGAEDMMVAATGQSVRSYSDMGFTVTPATWFDMKNDIMDKLETGDLSIDSLDPDEQQAVMDVLSSPSEDGLQALLNLPFMVGTESVGDYLLEAEQIKMTLPLDNENAVQAFREATS